MKKKIQTLKICIFVGVLLLPTLLWYGIRLFAPDTYQKLDYDLGEKRERAAFPQEFHMEDYTQQLEAYYNDNAPFRSTLISWQRRLFSSLEEVYTDHIQGQLARLIYGVSDDTTIDMEELFPGGKPPVPGHTWTVFSTQAADYTSYGYTLYYCTDCGKFNYDDLVAKQVDNSFLAPQIIRDLVLPGRFDWLFYAGDDSISYYRGLNVLEEEQMAAYLELMVQLQKLCDQRGIRLQFLILPNKEQVYPEYMPTYAAADTEKRIEKFVSYVREHSDVNIIYPLLELRQADIYCQAYHKYDTHWNHAGAFVGTQALYEALGMPVTNLYDLETYRCDPGTNDLVLLGGLDEAQYPIENDNDYLINYYKEGVSVTEIQGGKQPTDTYIAQSSCGNDKNLVFIGDSFRCFMIDFLVKDFSHSVITYRETTDNRTDYSEEVVESIRNADVLVLESVERYDYRLFPAVQKIIEILQSED